MDREFKTTFIPKKNLVDAKSAQPKINKKTKSLINLIALLLFITAVISAVGVYLYKVRVATVINSRNESIKRASAAFEPEAILELKKLDIRLRAATELLDKHIALSDFFNSFGESTLPEISFNDFSFNYEDGGSEVSVIGEAKSYLAIAQQSALFEKNRYIRNHIFSNFVLTEEGLVSFELTFTLDPSLLSFGRTTKNNQLDRADDSLIVSESGDVNRNTGTPVEFNLTN